MARIDPEKFGEALKAWSKAKKISLCKLAERVDVPPNSLYVYTRAPVMPSLTRMTVLAEALGLTLDQLAQGPHGEGLRDG